MELDTSQLPPRIVTALMLRGSQLPALQWHLNPNRTAKNLLDEAVTAADLFGMETVADEGMSAAARALLYLWNGWPEDARQWALKAPERERAYLEGLIERQQGNPDAAKTHFQATEEHPVYAPLAEFVPKAVADVKCSHLKRLGEVIAFVEQWEPFVFTDVFQLALEGQLDEDAQQVVRGIQGHEFEQLFKCYYQAATGRELKKQDSVAAPPQPKRRKPVTKSVRPPIPQAQKESTVKSKPPPMKPLLRPGLDVVVLCPHCNEPNKTAETLRGTVQSCCKCRASFKVPAKAAAAGKK